VDSFLTERDKSLLLADLGGKTSEAADIFLTFVPARARSRNHAKIKITVFPVRKLLFSVVDFCFGSA
jgi:hypothetical protein